MNLEKLIGKIKGDRQYSIESSYSNYEVLISIFLRSKQLLRGQISKLLGLKVSGFFFRGRGVSIKYKRLFQAKGGLIIGDFCHLNALSENGIKLGKNVTIERNGNIICTGVISRKGKGVTIGDNTGINANVYIGGQGGVTIGKNVIIGPGVQIHSENHNYKGSEIIKNQGETRKEVIIEDDCWIGGGAILLAGTHLKPKTIVAAGALVTKNFNGNSVIGGIPAKIIKTL